jgi:glycosyltransferase involved in cell wall biosynthesis
MLIAIVCNPLPAGWCPADRRLGGTEEAVVDWARELRRRGHDVRVYKNGPDGEWDGVPFRQHEAYAGREDVTLNVKCPELAPLGRTFYFTNETDASRHDLSMFDGVIWPSRWARDAFPVSNPRTYVVPHGYDPQEIQARPKIAKQVLYASSPDRGLSTLLRVWPRVVAAHPDARLVVTYGANVAHVPATLSLGELSRKDMAELFATSDVWCHPANGGELFCITGLKAQAAGCVPVYFPTMALSETVHAGVRSRPGTLSSDLIRLLGDEPEKAAIRAKLAALELTTLEHSCDALLAVLDGRAQPIS